jgi:hypothetical protein
MASSTNFPIINIPMLRPYSKLCDECTWLSARTAKATTKQAMVIVPQGVSFAVKQTGSPHSETTSLDLAGLRP